MAPPSPAVKRLFSYLPEQTPDNNAKRIKRPYHHHHCLQEPVNPGLPEPAIADDSYVDQVMNRTISQSLRECGFEIADPLALESFRDAAEEYLLKLASYVRASMLSSRRVQPIPNDFEYALKRHHLSVNSLLPYLQPPAKIEPIPTQLPSPPPEEEDDFKVLPSLGLSGEDDRTRSPYIPKHFPEFPSKHTYRHTPVFTERERDPRKIRERAADDGRHGEEALRKLARAAFKDNQPGSGGRDKKPWGRKGESFDSMFEKTVKGLSKKAQRGPVLGGPSAMEIDAGAAETEAKPGRSKGLAGIELPPIINCERDLWRRNAASGRQRPEEKSGAKHAPDLSRIESWQTPSRTPYMQYRHSTTLAALFFLEVLGHDVYMVREGFRGKERDERCHCKAHFGVAPVDELLELFMPSPQAGHDQLLNEPGSASGQGDSTSPTTGHQPPHFVPPPSTRRPYPVVEASSTSSGAGKSQLLYHLTALAILPSELDGVQLGGFGSAVVFIDTDGRFDAERLCTVARGIIQSRLQIVDLTSSLAQSIEATLLAALQHVHVFRPQSSLALLATLQSLDEYLLDLSRHLSASRAVHAIIIDSATAFFWQDKLQDEIARTEDIGRPTADIERERLQKENFYLSDIYADLVAALKRLQHIFDCTVIYTTISFNGKMVEKSREMYGSYNPLDTAFPNMPSFRSPLPPPWGLFPSLRLVLQREPVRPFPPSATLSEAQRDAPMRQEIVMRGEFVGSVNGWGREEWPRRLLEGLKRRDGGIFGFRVGREGVSFGR
ncbi:hypothetical protein BJY01DRAFT_231681 [Aspergillus pseudoustus]|uniref:Bromodomain associated domain-containing protein n=1 Tax=Aspergillus pseudoustus TaxID=1810923 RepID=A0ABR4KVV0_9EURO